ncbi:TetR/AcrR family transcriptional regulator [Streptomyces rugosispiralis]|uniref:TetR/AcrR family transcriptional regulator n=1 Tax=Streptomyces rugosispiralis TaxID=2967341 RepID=A0ABT1UZ50_9ACTN|nr:TetR/AcrR family transcriptional regulator [Streptomyces rugosispiralis]MCQ8190398.1 TetR/AcrR family transcriptional regulator [Streptomyces rugosispiralis]
MGENSPPRRIRADAERSTARILEAAETVLAADATASLEQIADAAGLARATVHRRFASRAALLDALAERLSRRYLGGLAEARVKTAPPLIALHRVTEIVFDLKLCHRFAIQLTAALTPEVLDGLDLLFARLRDTGAITAVDPAWCRQVYLALLHEVHELPADSPTLASSATADETEAKIDLLVRTTLGALGGGTPTGSRRSAPPAWSPCGDRS